MRYPFRQGNIMSPSIPENSIIFKDTRGKETTLIEIDLDELKRMKCFKNNTKEEMYEVTRVIADSLYRVMNWEIS